MIKLLEVGIQWETWVIHVRAQHFCTMVFHHQLHFLFVSSLALFLQRISIYWLQYGGSQEVKRGVCYLWIVTSSVLNILRSLGSLKVCLFLRGLSCMPSSNGTHSHGSLGTVTTCSFSPRLKHSNTSSSNYTCNTVIIYISSIHYTIIMSTTVHCLRCTWCLDNLRTEGTR